MTVERRRALVEERVLRLGEIDYTSLAREFDVSEMTIRRDVDRLAESGIVRRVTGGAIALPRKVDEPSFQRRVAEAAKGKAHIASAVADMLHPDETVILDSGSTVLAVARALRGRDLNLTVITPSLLVAIELSDEPGTTVILTGGALRRGELSLTGNDATDSLARYNADTFVMGVAGLQVDRGLSDYHPGESGVKKAAISASDRVIVAVDCTKLGRSTLVNIAPVSIADMIVCDAPEDDPVVIELRRLGIEVTCVPGVGLAEDVATSRLITGDNAEA